jgi:hypothetical protein
MAERDNGLAARNQAIYEEKVPQDVREKATLIQAKFAMLKYGLPGTPSGWEKAGQTASKTKVAAIRGGKLEERLPDYYDLIRRFNLETGQFEEIHLKTDL